MSLFVFCCFCLAKTAEAAEPKPKPTCAEGVTDVLTWGTAEHPDLDGSVGWFVNDNSAVIICTPGSQLREILWQKYEEHFPVKLGSFDRKGRNVLLEYHAETSTSIIYKVIDNNYIPSIIDAATILIESLRFHHIAVHK